MSQEEKIEDTVVLEEEKEKAPKEKPVEDTTEEEQVDTSTGEEPVEEEPEVEIVDESELEEDEAEEEVEIVEDEEAEIEDEEEEEDEGYRTKMKPDLSDDQKKALYLRDLKNKARPKFRRQEWFRYKRIGDSWRKPQGMHSKARRNYKYRVNVVSTGYRGPKSMRGRHSSGFKDVIVHNPKELDALDPKTQAARIAHTVGTRKRVAIEKKAKELDIRILNRGT